MKIPIIIASIYAIILSSVVRCAEKDNQRSTPPPTKNGKYVSVKGGLNVREKANVSAKRLFTLKDGTKVTTLETQPETVTIQGVSGHWVKIDYGSGTGWVFGGFLKDARVENEMRQATAQVMTGENAVLRQSTWTVLDELSVTNMTFEESSVRYFFSMEGVLCGIGPYAIAGTRVEIGATKPCGNEYGYTGLYPMKAQKCAITRDERAIEYRMVLKCDNGLTAGRFDSKPNEGELVDLNGSERISLGWKVAFVTEEVIFRTAPDVAAKKLFVDHGRAVPLKSSSLFRGERILLIARTKERSKVGNIENYWFYVAFRGDKQYRGWVYGEYVADRKPELNPAPDSNTGKKDKKKILEECLRGCMRDDDVCWMHCDSDAK